MKTLTLDDREGSDDDHDDQQKSESTEGKNHEKGFSLDERLKAPETQGERLDGGAEKGAGKHTQETEDDNHRKHGTKYDIPHASSSFAGSMKGELPAGGETLNLRVGVGDEREGDATSKGGNEGEGEEDGDKGKEETDGPRAYIACISFNDDRLQ
eukprot:1330160-Amorphochlora_amoeboformis.AAC.1